MTSHQKKISIVLGTRPEAIKLAPVILALEKDSDLESHVCITAQHREMLDENLAVFGIKADTDLDLMQADQRLDELVSSAIRAIGRCLSTEKPDLVLIQGDTITAFAAALAAFYNGIPVGHVEAGLRSGNMRAPWPEEMNRVLASRLSALHFAPTQLNRDNLLKEGIPANRIFVTGNTIVDALFLALEQTKNHPPVIPGLTEEILESWQNCPVVLIIGHRRENFGAGFERICQAVRMLSEKFNDVAFVYPVHLNPNVRNPVLKILSGRPNIHLIDPVSYLPFVRLLNASTLILTDSGGIQEEAPSL
ncbi:MAG: UDP-N-acetylglucosamine 2-epimerase (non-hydrolyzing), partial [Kiritimatiellae bacterium]|nr:UDP-N-acetylglucosamine 2-epimerase (non-hydrolyzing) [Kiritimatiellia bacterium]